MHAALLTLAAVVTAAPVPKGRAEADYWPRRVGDKWVYEQGRRELSEEVIRVAETDGVTRVTTTFSAVPGTSWEREYVVMGGAVYRATDEEFTYAPPVRLVDVNLKAGAKWGAMVQTTRGAVFDVGELVAEEAEEVTVPAGTFRAVPVVYTVRAENGRPLRKPREYRYWYAAGVGLVKLKFDGGERVLKAFTPGDGKPKAEPKKDK